MVLEMTVSLSFGLKVGNRVFSKPSLPTGAEFRTLSYIEVMAVKILNLVPLELPLVNMQISRPHC